MAVQILSSPNLKWGGFGFECLLRLCLEISVIHHMIVLFDCSLFDIYEHLMIFLYRLWIAVVLSGQTVK